MTNFKIHKVYYTPGQDTVTIAVQADSGPFAGNVVDLFTTQQRLHDLCPADRATWSDAECIAEAAAQLEKGGATLATLLPPDAKAVA